MCPPALRDGTRHTFVRPEFMFVRLSPFHPHGARRRSVWWVWWVRRVAMLRRNPSMVRCGNTARVLRHRASAWNSAPNSAAATNPGHARIAPPYGTKRMIPDLSADGSPAVLRDAGPLIGLSVRLKGPEVEV